MKVIKEMEQGILLNHFGLAGKLYLTVTVMTYFAFDNPDAPLNEQEMWPFVQGELGKDAILDMAMPKLKGEVLVWGRCFTPNGEPRMASQAGFQAGSIAKTLNVFGNRYWKRAAGAVQVISHPEPFTEMPVSYDRAFGGKDFEKNPLGRGMGPLLSEAGEEIYPLPNIEHAEKLIGSPDDRPDPAGFAPLDFMWPQRSRKLGTYDDKWLQERWPFYPDDMDWTYFNAAPDDQQMDRFFEGGESIIVRNMHRTRPVLETRVPALRHRCFMNQLEDVKNKDGERIFKEVNTRIDTLWLFPHAERGIALFRGSTEVADDEALDILHLYIVTESLSESRKPIEHYHEEFKKRLDRSVSADIAGPMEEARKKLEAAAERLKDLPLEINDAVARNLGEAPQPVRTPHEIINNSMSIIDASQNRLNVAEKRFVDLRAKYGHIVKIDLSGFDVARKQFGEAKGKLQGLAGMVDDMKAKSAANMAKVGDHLKKVMAGMDPALLKEKEIDPEGFLRSFEGEEDPWHTSGMRFVEHCRNSLMEHPDFLPGLAAMGFRRYHVKRSWLGINPEEKRFSRQQWGLKPAEKSDNPDELIIPPGFVIPRFDGAKLDRITIRPVFDREGRPLDKNRIRAALLNNAGDAMVDGSKDTAMAHSAGDKAFIRVADDLEAILLNQELGGFCAVVAMKKPDVKPDKLTAGFLEKAPQVLVVMYPGSPEAADRGIDKWKDAFPQAEPVSLPEGRNIFEAKKAEKDLWQWVADALHPGMAPDPETKPKKIDAGEPGALAALVPVIDVEGIIKKVNDTLMARMQPDLNQMDKVKKEMMDGMRKTLSDRGINPEQALKTPEKTVMKEANPFEAAKKEYAEKYANLRKGLADRNQLKPDVEKQLLEAEKKNMEILSQAAKQHDEGMAKLADVKAKSKAGPPDWAKKLMTQAGMDPSDPAPMKQLKREDVALQLKEGKSLAGKNLSGADLSDLDLRGVSFKGTHLQKAKLTGANLDGVDLSGAIAGEADFSHASLREAIMTKGVFQKAKFVKARMQLSDMTQALLNEADLTEADLAGAKVEMTLFEKAKLVGTKLADAQAKQGYFLSADASKANFSGADVGKAVFLKTNIDQADFSDGKARGTIFIEAKGENLNFSGADMYNSRILNESAMRNSDFTNTNAERACWMRSDLSGSDFRNSDLKRGLIEDCSLAGSELSGVKANQARLTKSDLSDANLQGVNMMFGSLRKSKLVRTDLRKANLYGAEFYRTGVGETKFDEANLKMTKLYKRTELIPDPDPKKK